MLKIHMDPNRLSVEELENISRALRGPCADCIERSVPDGCQHPEIVRHFLHGLADAIDGERSRRQPH
jgi:hypothetical protein